MAADNQTEIVREKRTPVYTFLRGVAALVFHTLFPVCYHQPERLTLKAPFILMANHLSWIDPVLLAIPCRNYEIRFVGKKELAGNPLLAWLIKKLHVISVDRHNTDMQAMRQCMRALREGHVLGIFPEGTRHLPDLMSEVETGTAVLALRANVPLVPIYISGKLRLLRRTHVYVGAPMDISDLSAQGFDAQGVERLTARIRDTFLTMRRESGHLPAPQK